MSEDKAMTGAAGIAGRSAYFKPNDMSPPRDPLLVEREKTHGSYADHAYITQHLKDVLKAGHPFDKKYASLSPRHRESLEMILHKIGRIMAGNPNFHDHWDDIAGYAKLGSEACD